MQGLSFSVFSEASTKSFRITNFKASCFKIYISITESCPKNIQSYRIIPFRDMNKSSGYESSRIQDLGVWISHLPNSETFCSETILHP